MIALLTESVGGDAAFWLGFTKDLGGWLNLARMSGFYWAVYTMHIDIVRLQPMALAPAQRAECARLYRPIPLRAATATNLNERPLRPCRSRAASVCVPHQ